jgi:hypothetical protein
VAYTLGYNENGGLYATWDDGNPAWEDIEYESENEYEFERYWKEDEKQNNDGEVVAANNATLKLAGYDRQMLAVQVSLKLV